jgi:hypothetical protein
MIRGYSQGRAEGKEASKRISARRAIDIRQGEKVDEKAFKALVRAAVELNVSGPGKPGAEKPAAKPAGRRSAPRRLAAAQRAAARKTPRGK